MQGEKSGIETDSIKGQNRLKNLTVELSDNAKKEFGEHLENVLKDGSETTVENTLRNYLNENAALKERIKELESSNNLLTNKSSTEVIKKQYQQDIALLNKTIIDLEEEAFNLIAECNVREQNQLNAEHKIKMLGIRIKENHAESKYDNDILNEKNTAQKQLHEQIKENERLKKLLAQQEEDNKAKQAQFEKDTESFNELFSKHNEEKTALVSQYENKIEETIKDYNQAKTTLQHKTDIITDLENKLSSQKTTFYQEVQSLQAELQTIQKQHSNERETLQKAINEEKSLNEQQRAHSSHRHREVQENIAGLNNKIKALEEDLENKNTLTLSLEEKINRQKQDIANKNDEHAHKLKNLHDTIEKNNAERLIEKGALLEKNNELKLKVMNLGNEKISLQEINADLKTKKDLVLILENKLTDNVENHKRIVKNLQKEIETTNANKLNEINLLSKENEELKSNNKAHEERQIEVQKSNALLQDNVNKLNQQLESNNNALGSFKNKISLLEKDLENLDKEHREKVDKLNAHSDKKTELLINEKNALIKNVEQLKSKLVSSEEKTSSIHKKNMLLLEQIKTLNHTLESKSIKLNANESKATLLESTVNNLNKKQIIIINEKSELEKDVMSLRAEIDNSSKSYSELLKNNELLEDNIKELTHSLESKNQDLNNVEAQIAELEINIDNLNNTHSSTIEEMLAEHDQKIKALLDDKKILKDTINSLNADLLSSEEKSSDIQKNNAFFTEQVKTLNHTIESKNHALNELENKISSMEINIDNLNNTHSSTIEEMLAEHDQKIKALLDDKKILKDTIDSLNADLLSSEEKSSDIQKNNAFFTEQVKTLNHTIESKNHALNELENNINNLNNEHSLTIEKIKFSYNEKIKQYEIEKNELQENLDLLTSKLQLSKENISNSHKNNAALSQQVQQLKEDVTSKKERIFICEDEIESLNNNINEINSNHKTNIEALTLSKNTLQQNISVLTSKFQDSENEISILHKSNGLLTEQVERLSQDIDSKNKTFNALKNKSTLLENTIAEFNNKYHLKSEEFNIITDEKNKLQKQLELSNSQFNSSEEKYKILHKSNDLLTDQVEELNNHLNSKNVALSDTENKNAELKNQLIKLENKLTSQIKNLNANKNELQLTIATLSAKLSSSENEISDTQKINLSLTQEIEELNHALTSEKQNTLTLTTNKEELHEKIASLNANLLSSEENLADFKNIKVSLTDQITDLNQSLSSLKSSHNQQQQNSTQLIEKLKNELQETVKNFSLEKADLLSKTESLNSRFFESDQRYKALQHQTEALESKYKLTQNSLDEKIKSYLNLEQAYEEEKRAFSHHCDELNQEKCDLNSEIKELNTALHNKQSLFSQEINKLKDQLQDQLEETLIFKEKNNTSRTRIEALVSEKQQSLKEFEKQIDLLNQKNKLVVDKIKLDAEINFKNLESSSQNKINELNNRIDFLKNEKNVLDNNYKSQIEIQRRDSDQLVTSLKDQIKQYEISQQQIEDEWQLKSVTFQNDLNVKVNEIEKLQICLKKSIQEQDVLKLQKNEMLSSQNSLAAENEALLKSATEAEHILQELRADKKDHDTQITQLTENVRHESYNRQKLKALFDENLAKHQKICDEKNAQIEELHFDIAEIKEAHKNSTHIIQQLNADNANLDQLKSNLENELLKTQQQLSDQTQHSQKHIADLNGDLSILEEGNEKLTNSLKKRQDELDTQNLLVDELKSSITKEKEFSYYAKNKIEQLTKELEKSQNDCAIQNSSKEKIELLWEKSKAKVEELENTLVPFKESLAKLNRITNEKDELERRHEELNQKYTKLTQEIDDWKLKVGELQNSLIQMSDSSRRWEERSRLHQDDIVTLKETIKNLHSEIENLRNIESSLRQDVEDFEIVQREHVEELSRYDNEYESKRMENKRLAEENDRLLRSVNRFNNEILGYQSIIKEKDDEIKNQIQKVLEFKKRISHMVFQEADDIFNPTIDDITNEKK